MAKTHYAWLDRANESDPEDHWSTTACGLEYTESPVTEKMGEVTCKRCLKRVSVDITNISQVSYSASTYIYAYKIPSQ